MNTLKKEHAPTLTPVVIPNAANDVCSPTAKDRLSNIRAMIGRSHAASQYEKLTEQQKAMVLFGARLKPSAYINTPLESMASDEREQVRLSIIALRNLGQSFGESLLSRDEFEAPRKAKTSVKKAPMKQLDQDVASMAAELALEVEKLLPKQITKSQA